MCPSNFKKQRKSFKRFHYQQLIKHLKTLQQTYLNAMQQPSQQQLPDPQQLQNHINLLVSSYAAACQKLAAAPQPPLVICRETLDMFIERTKANTESIEETMKKYEQLEQRQKQIIQQINTMAATKTERKTVIDYLEEGDEDNFISQIVEWENVKLLIDNDLTEKAILFLSENLLKHINETQKIEDICEGIMGFVKMTTFTPTAYYHLYDAIVKTIKSPAVSAEGTPAILDVYDSFNTSAPQPIPQ
ncbi:hypothetical protein EIN_281910 [Entamoeba invadens IP1]|uniref:Uncharacterized protein n=1 Tax=Entamoeba invadens IP1 TaxID=370355 RepID=A0A0A1TX02_ENTIV|nr:hypothetical protein EIN_281910 [Entamoeba invadens IP1]ELP85820.1 hypothetical protein EIN_281910 [Entamoeba invadens IP1]|eukprot:XP_004185166.1 hypothetical protein EIN_281910 [Entamoeba invadens IP1]